MKTPMLNIFALGKFTSWAHNILKSLEEQEVIQINSQIRSVETFCEQPSFNGKPSVVIIESSSNVREEVEQICNSGKPVYLVWMAKNFSTDDLKFAIGSRVYLVIDSLQTDESKIITELKNLSNLVESESRFQAIVRAMKSILLQTEAELPEIPMVKEFRNAISKLEHFSPQNEFNHLKQKDGESSSDLFFHRKQTLSETMELVSEVGRTGTLWVKCKSKDQEGTIDFIQGRMMGAHTGSCDGVKAIYRMFIWDEPTFLFFRKDPREMETTKAMSVDLMHVIRFGEMLRQRFTKIKSEIPPKNVKLSVSADSDSEKFTLSSSDFTTLCSVVEHGTVDQIVDFNQLSDVEIYESLINLRKNKIIRPAG